MPPRPFPFTLRLGTDICNVSRIRQMLARKGDGLPYLTKFTKRVLTEPERAYFWNRFGPTTHIATKLDNVSEFLAGRFAAKEAIRKACDQFGYLERGFQSIMILPINAAPRSKHQSSRPRGLILDRPYLPAQTTKQVSKDEAYTQERSMEMSIIVDDLDGQLCEISISHDGDFATAVALVPSMEEQSTRADRTETLRP